MKESFLVLYRALYGGTGRLYQADTEIFTLSWKGAVMIMKKQNSSMGDQSGPDHPILLTNLDQDRLQKLMDEKTNGITGTDPSLLDLDREISRAEIVDARDLPPCVVSMNSRVRVRINGKEVEMTLVYPGDADILSRRVSILSPVGTALLGYREGDSMTWEVPSGVSNIHIEKILYQPEAAGDFHL